MSNAHWSWGQAPVEQRRARLTAIVHASLLLLVLVLLFLLLRRLFVPEASTQINFTGWVRNIWLTFYPMGQRTALPGDFWVHEAWTFALGAWALATFVVLSRREQRQALFCLACVAITTAPGVTVSRINLLLLPILFFSLYLALVLGALAKLSRWIAIGVLLFLAALLVTLSIRHMVAQEAMHP
ncbi:MAG: hypothetical protein ACUVR2_11275, partial [Anaerolineae bacterium]